MIKTILPHPKVTSVEYMPQFSVICPVGKSPFHGRAVIEYEPADTLLEFESFEMWLRTLSLKKMTIEGLTRLIFDKLDDVLGEVPLTVAIHAETTVHAPAIVTIKRN